jgi:outer membrane protein assembly factor BamD
MRKLIVLTVAMACSTSLVTPAYSALVYRAGEGWVSESEDSGVPEKSASEQLHKAEKLENDGELKKSVGAYRTLLRRWPHSGIASTVRFRLAGLTLKLGDPDRAFNEYSKYLKDYPKGAEFDQAVEAQFKIATKFLNGERRRMFGVKTLPSMERAQQMFEEIIKNAPYSKYAGLAQFDIGQSLEKQGKYPEAVNAYQKAIDQYPNDQVAADAQYQIGYVYLKQAKEGSNDQTARNRARESFEDFTMRYPDSEKVGQARENLSTLSSKDVRKSLDVAMFYERTKNFKAAALYYQDVIRDGAGTKEAELAQKQLAKLKSTVGEDALRAGPEKTETGETVAARRKMQAKVDTSSRPDFAGPPAPPVPDEVPPAKPKLRTSGDAGLPPALPSSDPQPAKLDPSNLELAPAPAPAEPALPSH